MTSIILMKVIKPKGGNDGSYINIKEQQWGAAEAIQKLDPE